MRLSAVGSLVVLETVAGLMNYAVTENGDASKSLISAEDSRLTREEGLPVAGLAIAAGVAATLATRGGASAQCELNVYTIDACGSETVLQNRRDFLRGLADTYVVDARGRSQPWAEQLGHGAHGEYSDELYHNVAAVVDALAPGRIVAANLVQVLGMNSKLALYRRFLLPATFAQEVPPPGGMIHVYLYPSAPPGQPLVVLHVVFGRTEIARFFEVFRVPFSSPRGVEHLRARFELKGEAACAGGSSTWGAFSQWVTCEGADRGAGVPAPLELPALHAHQAQTRVGTVPGPCTQASCSCLEPEDRSWTDPAMQYKFTAVNAIEALEEVAAGARPEPRPGQAFQCSTGTVEIDDTPAMFLPADPAAAARLFQREFTAAYRTDLARVLAARLGEAFLGRRLPRGCHSLHDGPNRDPAKFCFLKSAEFVRDKHLLSLYRGAVGLSLLFDTDLLPGSSSVNVVWWQVRDTKQALARSALGKSLWTYTVVRPGMLQSLWGNWGKRKRAKSGAGRIVPV